MKALFFPLYILGVIYAATRWEILSYVLIGVFLFGGVYALLRATANYLHRHRYF